MIRSDVADYVRTYFTRPAASDYAGNIAMFEDDGWVDSPYLGKVSASEFFSKLGNAFSHNTLTVHDVLVGENGDSAAAQFEYDWTLSNGDKIVFLGVDYFKFGPTGKFASMSIFYDTHPTREGVGDKYKRSPVGSARDASGNQERTKMRNAMIAACGAFLAALVMGTAASAQSGYVNPASAYEGGQAPADIIETINDAGYWSRSMTVFDTKIGPYKRYYARRHHKLTVTHAQGVTYTSEGRLIFSFSLEPEVNGTSVLECGFLAWSTPFTFDDDAPEDLEWSTRCIFDSWHPSIVQSSGKLIMATDNHLGDFDKKMPTGYRGTPASARFFIIGNDNKLKELTHLKLSGGKKPYETVAITYNEALDRHYVVHYPGRGDSGRGTLHLYHLTNGNAAGSKCPNLEDPKCKFEKIGEIDDVFWSSSGLSVLARPDGNLVVVAMYSPDGIVADYFRTTVLDPRRMVKVQEIGPENMGTSQVQWKPNRPSCRYGCSLNIVGGDLIYTAVARDIGSSSNLEFGMYKVD